jgi:hypothetical protein
LKNCAEVGPTRSKSIPAIITEAMPNLYLLCLSDMVSGPTREPALNTLKRRRGTMETIGVLSNRFPTQGRRLVGRYGHFFTFFFRQKPKHLDANRCDDSQGGACDR